MIKNYKINYHYICKGFFMALLISITWVIPIKSNFDLWAILFFPSLFVISNLLSIQITEIDLDHKCIKLYFVFFIFFKWHKQLLLKSIKVEIKEVQAGRSLTRKNTELILTDSNTEITKISTEDSGWSKEVLYQVYYNYLQISQNN